VPEYLHGARDEHPGITWPASVVLNGERAPAIGIKLSGCGLSRCLVEVRQHDGGATCVQVARRLTADSASSAGHDRYQARKIEHMTPCGGRITGNT
jgi:hypothetical protein